MQWRLLRFSGVAAPFLQQGWSCVNGGRRGGGCCAEPRRVADLWWMHDVRRCSVLLLRFGSQSCCSSSSAAILNRFWFSGVVGAVAWSLRWWRVTFPLLFWSDGGVVAMMVVATAWRIRSADALWFWLALMVVREESKSGAGSVADSCGRRWWLLREMKVHERLHCRHGFLAEKMTRDGGCKVCGFESGSQVQWWLTMEVAAAATGGHGDG